MRLAVALIAAGAVAATGLAASVQTVTISADPPIIRWPTGTTLSGTISSGKSGELVNIDGRDCPSGSFRLVSWVRTTAGGAWTANVGPLTRTAFRARWGDVRSRSVVILVRPHIVLAQTARRQFKATLLLGTAADGKRLVLQGFDNDERIWRAVRTIVFRDSGSSPAWPKMSFAANVPPGTALRLNLPRAQAQPCYLAGYSNILTT